MFDCWLPFYILCKFVNTCLVRWGNQNSKWVMHHRYSIIPTLVILLWSVSVDRALNHMWVWQQLKCHTRCLCSIPKLLIGLDFKLIESGVLAVSYPFGKRTKPKEISEHNSSVVRTECYSVVRYLFDLLAEYTWMWHPVMCDDDMEVTMT